MLTIGLTGNLGTGKTTVSEMMAELGAILINADKLGHELFQPDNPTYYEIIATFGEEILTPDNEIDRQKLSQLVFADTQALTRLNQIMHPEMYNIVQQRIEQYRNQGAKVVVLEAALLIEANWVELVDEIWVTTAPEAAIVKRLTGQRGLSKKQILERLHSQMSSQEKTKQADVAINTDCTINELKAKMAEIWQKLQDEQKI